MELSKMEVTVLVNAIEVVIAQVKRAMTKEVNPEVVRLRGEQLHDLRNLSNKLLYGSKELV